MNKVISILIILCVLFSVFSFNTSAQNTTNVPKSTPLIISDAISSGDFELTDSNLILLEICDTLYNGLINLETTIDISSYQLPFDSSSFYTLCNCLFTVLSYPDLFQAYLYCDFEYTNFYSDPTQTYFDTLEVFYLPNFVDSQGNEIFDRDLALKETQEYFSLVDNLVDSVPENFSNLEKMLYVYDYFALNFEYVFNDDGTNYDAYHLIKEKVGVCDAYAKLYNKIMSELGIPAIRAVSVTGNHAWSIVKLNGKYYHVDSTWADPVPDLCGQVSHKYFLLSNTALEEKDTNSSHKDWDITESIIGLSIDCTDVTYDQGYVWQDAATAFGFYNNEFYYLDDTSYYIYEEDDFNSYLTSLSTQADIKKTSDFKSSTTIKTIFSYPWMDKNGSAYFLKNFHSGFYMVDSQIYFNDYNTIRYYDIQTGQIGELYTASDSNITGFHYKGNGTFLYSEFGLEEDEILYTKSIFTISDMGCLTENSPNSYADDLINMRKYLSTGDSRDFCLIKGDISSLDGTLDVRDLVALKHLAAS